MEALNLRITFDALSDAFLIQLVPEGSQFFLSSYHLPVQLIVPTLLATLAVTLFQGHVDHFISSEMGRGLRVVNPATGCTFLRPAVLIPPLPRPIHLGEKNPNFLFWVLRFSTLLYEEDSPLFSALARLVNSLFPEICFIPFVHTIPFEKKRQG